MEHMIIIFLFGILCIYYFSLMEPMFQVIELDQEAYLGEEQEDNADTEPIVNDESSDDFEGHEELERRRLQFYDEEGNGYTLEHIEEQNFDASFQLSELPYYDFSNKVEDEEIERLIGEKLVGAFRFNQVQTSEE